MTGPIAMSGNKITGLAAATSNGDAVRYEQLPATVLITSPPIDIGDWNMNSTGSVLISIGSIDHTKVRKVHVAIRSDDPAVDAYSTYDLLIGGSYALQITNISLSRTAGGFFDNVSFNATSYNRGWITIEYTP